MKSEAIRHMVIFCLSHEINSPETAKFLNDAKNILSAIPSVQNFEVFNQISSKNDFNFGFSMQFENQLAYDVYNNHPDHVSFVKSRWEKEVTRFLEIDFTAAL